MTKSSFDFGARGEFLWREPLNRANLSAAMAALRAKIRPLMKPAKIGIDPRIAAQFAETERDLRIAEARVAELESRRTAAELAGDARTTVAASRELAAGKANLADAREVFDAADAIRSRAAADVSARASEANGPTWLAIRSALNAELDEALAAAEKALTPIVARLAAFREMSNAASFERFDMLETNGEG